MLRMPIIVIINDGDEI